MREEANVDVVRRILDLWNRGDLGLELMDPGIEMHQVAMVFDTAGVFHGHEGVAQAGRELLDGFSSLRWEAEEFIPGPDGNVVVPVLIRGYGRVSSAPAEIHATHVWTIRDGLAVRWRAYEGRHEALAAAGLSE